MSRKSIQHFVFQVATCAILLTGLAVVVLYLRGDIDNPLLAAMQFVGLPVPQWPSDPSDPGWLFALPVRFFLGLATIVAILFTSILCCFGLSELERLCELGYREYRRITSEEEAEREQKALAKDRAARRVNFRHRPGDRLVCSCTKSAKG